MDAMEEVVEHLARVTGSRLLLLALAFLSVGFVRRPGAVSRACGFCAAKRTLLILLPETLVYTIPFTP